MIWLLLACSVGRSTAPLHRVADELVATVDDVVVGDCSWVDSTAGSCVLEGPASALDQLLTAAGATEDPSLRLPRDPCLSRYRFGAEVDAPTRVLAMPRHDVLRAYRIDGAVCVVIPSS